MLCSGVRAWGDSAPPPVMCLEGEAREASVSALAIGSGNGEAGSMGGGGGVALSFSDSLLFPSAANRCVRFGVRDPSLLAGGRAPERCMREAGG